MRARCAGLLRTLREGGTTAHLSTTLAPSPCAWCVGSGDDLPTEELLLAALCRLTAHCRPPEHGQPLHSHVGAHLLAHLTQPKLLALQQAATSLAACAPSALQALAGAGAPEPGAHGWGAAAQQLELVQAAALAERAGVCLDVLQMVVENTAAATTRQQAQDAAPVLRGGAALMGSPPLQAPVSGPGGCALVLSGGGSAVSRTSSFTAQSQTGEGQAPPPPPPQQQQQQPQEAEQRGSEQAALLARAVWDVLRPSLPHLASVPAVMGPACALFACALRSVPRPHRAEVQLLGVQLLQHLPPRVLVTPKAVALLVGCLASRAPGEGDGAGGLASGAHAAQAPSAAAALGHAVGAALEGVAHAAVAHGCEQAVASSSDPQVVVAVLGLCSAALSAVPRVLVAQPSTLRALLAMTRATAHSYDAEQCKHWLAWAEQLVCAPYDAGRQQPPGRPQAAGDGGLLWPEAQRAQRALRGAGAGPHQGWEAGAARPAADQQQDGGLAALAHVLLAGVGAQVVWLLLMAASGGMPPDQVQPISMTLHQIWHGVGTER